MPQLDIRYSDGRHDLRPIEGDQWIIGRDASCDLPLDDAVTSRRHARLYHDEHGHFWIQDLQSKNGTLVNDQRVNVARVQTHDRIAIGGCLLRLMTTTDQPSIVLSDVPSDTQGATTNAWGRAHDVNLAEKRLRSLYELNERLTGRFDRDDLLGELLNICIEYLRFERAGVAVWPGDPHQPQWVQIKSSRGDDTEEIRISRSIVDRALRNGERILINDTSEGTFDPTASMIAGNILSAMCVPMEYHEKVRGVIYGDRVSSTGGYQKADIDYFAALGRLGAMGLANVQLVAEIKEREKIQMQLQVARQIQSQLFPGEPLVADNLDVDALNDPGQQVSGDYYDYFQRPDGLTVIVMADVAGKGAAAALLMSNLQAAVHVTLMMDADLARATKVFNELAYRNGGGSKFITGIIGLLDPRARRFSYINAGHMGPYLLGPNGRFDKINPAPDLPLGVESHTQYETQVIELPESPSTLLFYTDGVTEAENPQGELFGEARLAEMLKPLGGEAPAELITRARRSIKQFVRNHPQTDDITLLAARLA